ncbi:MAG: PEP-CTERM system TPR-repeat protein PrsT, partial [Gammaproteobacteria bacterium]|nr:PEP-CTERM system TPR-repeat protein PrsT [Gammaproteobacteria bacterium]
FKQNANDPETNYIGGLLAFEQADFEQAEVRLLKVLKVAPEHAKSQLLFGSVNFAQKKYEQAAYYIGKYLQEEPENMGARKLLGRTYILLGQHEDAQATLRPGLQGAENDAELLALVGLSQMQAGDITSGITDLEKAVVAAPDSKTLRGELAKAYISAGETENAIKQLNKILAEGGNKNQAEVLMVSAYLRDKQYDQAISVALNILERAPQDAAVLSLLGNVFAASGDRIEARKYFNQALTIEPGNSQATMLLAALEEVDGNTAEAEQLYKSLVKNDATSINPILALARLSEQKKDYKAMVAWLEKANENAPMELRPKIVLAEYYLRENKFDKVEGLIKQATVISANDPAVLFIKGKMLMTQKRYNEAVPPLAELVTRNPESVFARSLLGETYLNLQQTGDARRQLELALEQKPYYVPALLVLARVEQVTKKYPQGLEHIEKAIKAQPDLYLAYDLGGDISMSAKNYAAANDYYQKVMLIKPNSATAIKSAEVLIQLSKNQQAIKVLEQWLSENTEDVRARQFLGSAYLTNGDNKEAIQAFEEVYATQPENIVALNNLAWLYSLKNDFRALEFAEKAYKAKPNDSGIQDTYGWILVQQGEVEAGRRILERALKGLPEVPDVRYHYAVALLRSGEKTAADKILKQLLQSDQPYEWREEAQKLVSQ